MTKARVLATVALGLLLVLAGSIAIGMRVVRPRTVIAPDPASIRDPRDVAEFDRLFARVSNWGRWGADDELGAANLITDAKRREAAALVRVGRSVSLSHVLTTRSTPGVTEATFAGNGIAVEHHVNEDRRSDVFHIDYHSFLHSHLDALCHFPYAGKDYNGYPTKDVNTATGCRRLGVHNLRNGLVTRGVLIDIPRLKGLPWLEPGTAVFTEDIEAWEKKAGVTVSPGDAIFLRTGRWVRWNELGPWNVSEREAGMHPSVVSWLKERGVAIIGSDDGLDVLPSPVTGVPELPMHVMAINALGIVLLDNHDLESLAATAAELDRWEFMVSVAPLVVDGATGSPVNTLALF